jgi:predicted lipid-binding transport protein (Tim44 family)
MNNSLIKIVLFGLLLMLVIAPFAGVAPLMLILLGLGLVSTIGSLVQAFFVPDSEHKDKNA